MFHLFGFLGSNIHCALLSNFQPNVLNPLVHIGGSLLHFRLRIIWLLIYGFLKHIWNNYYATTAFRILKIMKSRCTLHSVQLCCCTFIAKQKMYRHWHSTWHIPQGHCLYYHRHYHLHQFSQFTSVDALLATTIASDQI